MFESQRELQNSKDTILLLEDTVKEKDRVIQMLRGEISQKQHMLERSEERCLKLSNDNLLMTERLKDEKMRLMEEMNRMTELNDQIQAKLNRLQASSNVTDASTTISSSAENDWLTGTTKQAGPPKTAVHTFQAHDTEIPSISFNEDGSCFATGCSDGTVKVWQTEARTCKHELRASSGPSSTAVLCVHMHGKLVIGSGR